MTLTPGQSLGPYQVEALAGAGAMGEVYRARDTRLNRVVAIKVLPAHVATFDVHPDGRRIVVEGLESYEADIGMIEIGK